MTESYVRRQPARRAGRRSWEPSLWSETGYRLGQELRVRFDISALLGIPRKHPLQQLNPHRVWTSCRRSLAPDHDRSLGSSHSRFLSGRKDRPEFTISAVVLIHCFLSPCPFTSSPILRAPDRLPIICRLYRGVRRGLCPSTNSAAPAMRVRPVRSAGRDGMIAPAPRNLERTANPGQRRKAVFRDRPRFGEAPVEGPTQVQP